LLCDLLGSYTAAVQVGVSFGLAACSEGWDPAPV